MTELTERELAAETPILCVYCDHETGGLQHDEYGELVMGRADLVVCKPCRRYLDDEPGPWSDWS